MRWWFRPAVEAHACGTPVVAFHTRGLPDIVEHQRTGYLAQPFDTQDLAAGIRWVLEDPQRRIGLGLAARQRAERLWAPARVAGLYAEVYGHVIERSVQKGTSHFRYAEPIAGLGR